MNINKQTKHISKKYSIFSILSLFVIMLLSMNSVFSALELRHIQFDPTIVAAGDEVNIIIQFENKGIVLEEDKISNPDYSFQVKLVADDDLSKEYITVTDSLGDYLHGSIFNEQLYTKNFRVKVSQEAPAGNYQFKLIGQWYKNGVKTDTQISSRFEIPVKLEGIILEPSTITTNPSQIRAGDDFVELTTRIYNAGEKDSKSVEVELELPEYISHSYSNNNRVYIPRINAGESAEVSFFVNVDEHITSDVYDINLHFNYMDIENNKYSRSKELELLIKPRAYLEVIEVEGEGLSGSNSEMRIYIQNTGEQSAESVDVRIIKQNSQPFEFDVRSDYIGELKPNETGVAIFSFDTLSKAEIKNHSFKVLIRSVGDSEVGDDNIYTYDRRANFEVTGKAPNRFIQIGVPLLVLFLLYLGYAKFRLKPQQKNSRRRN